METHKRKFAKTVSHDWSEQSSPSRLALFGAAFFVLVSVGRVQELWPPLYGLPLARISLALGLVGYLFSKRDARHRIRKSDLFVPILFLLGLCTITIFWSVWQQQTFDMLKDALLPIVVAFFLMTKVMSTFHAIRFMLRALALAGILLATITIANDWSGRLQVSTTYDPNDLALILVTLLPIQILEALRTSGLTRLLYLGFGGASTLAILLTQSRGGFIALIIVVFLISICRFDDSRGRFHFTAPRLPVVLLLFLLGAVAWINLPDDGRQRLLSIFNLSSDYNLSDESGRLAIWGRAMESIAERPWGSGFGTIGVTDGLAGGRYKTAHNSFIQVGVELGIAGFVAYFLIFWRTARKLLTYATQRLVLPDPRQKDVRYWSAGLLIGLAGFCTAGFFLSQAYSWILVSLLSLFIAIEAALQRQVAEDDNRSKQPPTRR